MKGFWIETDCSNLVCLPNNDNLETMLCTLDMLKSGKDFEFPIFQSWAHYYSKLNWLSVLSNLDDQNKRFSIPMHLLRGFDFEELLTKVSYLFIVVLILKFPFDQQHETC